MIVQLRGYTEDGTVYATGFDLDGSPYLAVADNWQQLHECIRASAQAEGWLGWSLLTGFPTVQVPL